MAMLGVSRLDQIRNEEIRRREERVTDIAQRVAKLEPARSYCHFSRWTLGSQGAETAAPHWSTPNDVDRRPQARRR
ncbi:jg24055 [Pararge aegeria aegeria]|uniref:Jg24055 protein n=1 Tax=Pararge aegeria aegeria TaxID=348720 RepID=A0A8S4S336_9NEOP|nr:jg24055 [Pararge aegeria aegeria]